MVRNGTIGARLMKVYVDLLKTNLGDIEDGGYKFAWWDTVVSEFESHSGSMAWDDWGYFLKDYIGRMDELERYWKLYQGNQDV